MHKVYWLAFNVGDGALVAGFTEQKNISNLYNCKQTTNVKQANLIINLWRTNKSNFASRLHCYSNSEKEKTTMNCS